MERAYSIFEIKSIREDQRIIEGMATTPGVDRMGDIVEPLGAEFSLPIPFLWQHNHDEPVGSVIAAKASKTGIWFRAQFAKTDEPGALKDRLDEAWQSIKLGLVRAVSIGFKDVEHTVMESGGWRFVKWAWLELSGVTIPANMEATITTIKSIDRELRGAPAREKRIARLSSAGASALSSQKSGSTAMKTLSEQISAAEVALDAKTQRMAAIHSKADGEGRATTDAENEEFDVLDDEVTQIEATLKRLRRLSNIKGEKNAKAVDGKTGDELSRSRGGETRIIGLNKNLEPGILFARAVTALVQAGGNKEIAAMLAAKNYGVVNGSDAISAFLTIAPEQKSAVPAAYTGGSGWADAIAAANVVANEFIEYLRPKTLIGRIQGFRPAQFNSKTSRMTTGQAGYWVGEALPSPLTSGVFDTVTLNKTKVASISVLSKEQARFSHINAELAIRNDLAKAVAQRMDQTLVSTTAASSGVSPAGLLNGLTAQSATGSGDADDVRSDLQTLYEPFSNANISSDSITIITTEQLRNALMLLRSAIGVREFPDVTRVGGLVEGYPILASNLVGAGDVIGLSAENVLLADDGDVSVEASDQVSLEMLDAALQQTGQGGTGASLVSMWQAGMVAIKCERFVNWAKGNSAAVAYIGNAAWNGAPAT